MWIGLVAWTAAQVGKILLHLIMTGQFCTELLWSSGGMPSAHSALVSSLTAGLLRYYGGASALFQCMLIMSLIVMHDAMGVRRQTGEHARALNSMLHEKNRTQDHGGKEEKFDEKAIRLYKEMIGHTPAQVLIGALLGISVGLFLPAF